MGMFDTLYAPCPMCKERVEIQSKSGPCVLEEFNWEDDLPIWLMLDLDGTIETCYKCNRRFRIRFDLEVKVNIKCTEPVDNLDVVEWTDRQNKEKKDGE